MSSPASQVSNVQYAALPWRRRNDVIEFLLITTRTTKRWILPKGWPQAGLSPGECAAREALEEAGVVGEIAVKPLGTFQHAKSLKSGAQIALHVQVFAMEVARQHRAWPEKHLRETRWCPLDEALQKVSEPSLRRLLTKFVREWE